MAKTDDILDIHPLERMDKLDDIRTAKKKSLEEKRKELAELESQKKQEIEELERKKRTELENLEKKKQELSDFERKKAAEIKETEELIEKSFQDLMRHKRMLISEEQAKKNSLETIAQDVSPKAQGDHKNSDYGHFFEELQVPHRLYDITNRGFYDNLNILHDRALSGDLTPQEENFVELLREKFENFSQPAYISNRDDRQYVQRSMKLINEISVSLAYR